MKKYMFSRDGQTMVRPPELIIIEELRRRKIAALKAAMLDNGQVCITVAIGAKRWEPGCSEKRDYTGPWMLNGNFNVDGFANAIGPEIKNIDRMNAMDEALE